MKLVLITISLLLIPNLLAISPSPNGPGCPRCKNVEGEGDLAGIYYFHTENSKCENGCSYKRDDGECCFCFAPGNYSVTKCDYAPPTDGDCYNNYPPLWNSTCNNLTHNDVQTCNNYNKQHVPSFTYFSLGMWNPETGGPANGNACCAGWSAPPANQKVDPSNCSVPCPGNNTQTCGDWIFDSMGDIIYVNVWKRII